METKTKITEIGGNVVRLEISGVVPVDTYHQIMKLVAPYRLPHPRRKPKP